MNTKTHSKTGLAIAASFLTITMGMMPAQTTLYWYPNAAPNQGGTGSWDATTSRWSTTSGGTKTAASAIPADGDSVVFGGAAGTVTYYTTSGEPQINDWKVETAGYVFKTNGSGMTYSVNTFSGSALANATFESGGLHATTFEIRSDTAFSGTIRNGTNTQSVTKTGTGRWDLSDATLTYTGNTVINNGSLWMNTSDVNGLTGQITFANAANLGGNIVAVGGGTITKALGTGIVLGGAGSATSNTRAGFGARGGDLTLNFGGASGTVGWGSAGMRAETITLGTADSTHKVTLTNGIKLDNDGRVLRVENGSAAVDAEITGAFTTATGNRLFTKEGNGTLALSGTTSASVRLNQTAGTILLDGSWTSSTTDTTYGINVEAGAVLGGNGSITLSNAATQLTVSGALQGGRGEADQSLTISSNLKLENDSVLVFGLGATSADRDQIIRAGGTWAFDTDQRVQLFDQGYDGSSITFALITGLTADPGVSGWQIYNPDPGIGGTFSYSGGTVYLNAVPEPATWVLLGIGSTFLLRRRRTA